MLRKLLTLLAICAGLTAVAEPARAATIAVESVQVLDRGAPVFASRSTASLATGSTSHAQVTEKGKPCPKTTIVVVVPTVMLQADRARE